MRKITLALLSLIAVLAFLAAGCGLDQPEAPELTVTPDTMAIFSEYYAIGNSLTAGYMDGGLMLAGQLDSYPFQIARAMGNPAFTQPLLNSPGVGNTSLSAGWTAGVLYTTGGAPAVLDSTQTAMVPLLFGEIPGAGGATWAEYPHAYNNLGVPGATLMDATNATSSANSQSPGNSFFDLILRNPFSSLFGNTTMAEQCIHANPALVTCWLGNNDVLGAAMSGSPVADVNMTPVAAFESMYRDLIIDLQAGVEARTGVKPVIVVANIPSITDAAYFVQKAVIDPFDLIPMEEDSVQIILYPALGVIPGLGGADLPANYTLTAAEVRDVAATVEGYNTAIAAIATEFELGLYDANAELAGLTAYQKTHLLLLAEGMAGDFELAEATTIFSLDGIHPNNHGYTIIADGFIDAINAATGKNIGAAVPYPGGGWDATYGNGWDAPPKAGTLPQLPYEVAHALDGLFLK